MSSTLLHEQTDQHPVHHGHWMPVYLKTVPGADERICVVVAAVDTDGHVHVERTLPPAKIRMLFDSAGEGVNRAIDWAVVSLVEHLHQHRNFARWTPPASHFVAGHAKPSADSNLKGLITKARVLSTAFGEEQL